MESFQSMQPSYVGLGMTEGGWARAPRELRFERASWPTWVRQPGVSMSHMTDEKNARRKEIRRAIGHGLRVLYQEGLEQPLPNRLKDLLGEVEVHGTMHSLHKQPK